MSSGYIVGQPIVEGLTPYTVRRITVPGGDSGDWPPDIDANRLARYADYEALIENRPEDVFTSRLGLRPEQVERLLLAVGLPELICNVWADGLYGENAPGITFPRDDVTELWREIWDANGGDDVLGWEAIFGTAMSGTGVEHVYRDDDDVVHIESISPSIFFPRLKRGSSRTVEAVVLAWEEERAKPGSDSQTDTYQIRKTYEVSGGQLEIVTSERRATERGWREVDRLEPDGVDFLPFVDMHAKRWRGRYWGMSELARGYSLFGELSATASRIATVLDYHGEPTLQVPASVLFGGVLPKGADRVIGIRNPADAEIARYIEFTGQLDQQFAEIDKTIALVLLTSEIERSYVGEGEPGQAASGTSLRLRLQGTVKKWGRWQRKDEERIRRLADIALRLSDDSLSDEDRTPKYQAGSPLPIDDEQEVRILSIMLNDGTISRKSYMRATRRFDDVEEEIEQIEQEQSETAPTSGFGLPAGVPVVGAPAGLTAATPPAQGVATGIPPELRGGPGA